MYSLKAVLTQSPEKIKSTVLAVLGALVILGVFGDHVSGEAVAAVGIGIERLLDLFYVAPVRKAQDEAFLNAIPAS